MALIDHDDVSGIKPTHETTKHPRLCLLGFVAFLVGVALAVHLVINLVFNLIS
jgi:hypothetical protein